MPILCFQCEKCGKNAESFQKLTDKAPECAECKVAMKRVIGEANFRLRGPGWTGSVYSKYRKDM